MIDKAHLRDKTVIVRITGAARMLTAVVLYVENDGIWLTGGDFVAQLAAGAGGLPVGLKSPAIYVPFSQLVLLIASNE